MLNQFKLQQRKACRITLGIPQNVASFTPTLTISVPPQLERPQKLTVSFSGIWLEAMRIVRQASHLGVETLIGES